MALARLSLAGDVFRDMAEIVMALIEAFADDGPLAGIRPIVVQVWAEAPRDPEMAVLARDLLGDLAERAARVLPAGTPPEVPGCWWPRCRVSSCSRWCSTTSRRNWWPRRPGPPSADRLAEHATAYRKLSMRTTSHEEA